MREWWPLALGVGVILILGILTCVWACLVISGRYNDAEEASRACDEALNVTTWLP